MGDMRMGVFPAGETTVHGALVQGEGFTPSTMGSVLYLNAPNLDAVLERVNGAGGQCVRPADTARPHGPHRPLRRHRRQPRRPARAGREDAVLPAAAIRLRRPASAGARAPATPTETEKSIMPSQSPYLMRAADIAARTQSFSHPGTACRKSTAP